MLTPDELAGEIAGLPGREPVERARAAKTLIDDAKTTLSAVRKAAIVEATDTATYEQVADALGVSTSAINAAVVEHRRAGGGSAPSRVRRARQRRHDQERDPAFVRAAIRAELMAWDETPDRQHLDGGAEVELVVDDILAGWLAHAAQSGFPDGLRGWVGRYVRRVDGHGDETEAWRRHVTALNDREG